MFLGRLNSRVYVAFAPLIVLGTIEAASIPVVGFNAVLMSEHFGAFCAFLVLHAAMGIKYIKVQRRQDLLPEHTCLCTSTLRVVMVNTADSVTCTRAQPVLHLTWLWSFCCTRLACLGHKQLQAQAATLLLHAPRVQSQRC